MGGMVGRGARAAGTSPMGGGARSPFGRSVADYNGNQAQQCSCWRGSGRWHSSSAGARRRQTCGEEAEVGDAAPSRSWYKRGLSKPRSPEALFPRGVDGLSRSGRLWGRVPKPGLARALRHWGHFLRPGACGAGYSVQNRQRLWGSRPAPGIELGITTRPISPGLTLHPALS